MYERMLQTWITGGVSVAILVGWLSSFIIGYTQEDWTPLTVTTPVMLLLAGYAFGVKIIKGKNGHD